MILPGVFLVLLLALVAEALVLWLGGLAQARNEEAYWKARDNRPPLYDWETDL